MEFPVNLRLAGRRCLVVGGGTVAARKVEALVAAGARVSVVAPQIVDELAGRAGVALHRRSYRRGEVRGYWLVVAATDDVEVNQAVFDDGEAAGVWVNGADDPERCSFTLPSVLRRGDLTVAVSTGGRSPALAKWLRMRLGDQLGPEYEALLDLLAAERQAVRAAGRSTEGLDWDGALDSSLLPYIRQGDLGAAQARLSSHLSGQALGQVTDQLPGGVSAGPSDGAESAPIAGSGITGERP
ncbi:MAG: precorrin-2 dehydrogenase/sirohydrochlorin ferrochelatase family protein [Acidimicrobiales bacterium]